MYLFSNSKAVFLPQLSSYFQLPLIKENDKENNCFLPALKNMIVIKYRVRNKDVLR